MEHVYLLSADDETVYAFTSYEHVVGWFIENIVQEYCDYCPNADEILTDLCGGNYLEPECGVLEILLDKFDYKLQQIPLDPN